MMTMAKGTEALTTSSSSKSKVNLHAFTRTVTGYKKQLRNKVCEDAVLLKRVKDGVICAVADGHGDPKCRYANIGARLAVETACEVLRAVYDGSPSTKALDKNCADNREAIIKEIIMRWNAKVFGDFLDKPEGEEYAEIGLDVLSYIDEIFSTPSHKMSIVETRAYYERRDKYEELLHKAALLYGTTLNAVLSTDKFIFCIGIGDGDIVAVQGKKMHWLLPAGEQFSTRTESLCWKPNKAFDAFKTVAIIKSKSKKSKSYMETGVNPDFILISTDGLRNSFLDDEDFMEKIISINSEVATGYSKFQRNSQKWIGQRTKDSLYQDDITFGFIY